jgi:hypothetical protein
MDPISVVLKWWDAPRPRRRLLPLPQVVHYCQRRLPLEYDLKPKVLLLSLSVGASAQDLYHQSPKANPTSHEPLVIPTSVSNRICLYCFYFDLVIIKSHEKCSMKCAWGSEYSCWSVFSCRSLVCGFACSGWCFRIVTRVPNPILRANSLSIAMWSWLN